MNQLQRISNLSPCLRLFYTLLLIVYSFRTANHPDHMKPTLHFLPDPRLSLTMYPNATPHPFSFHLFFSPSQLVWVNEFPLECRIPVLIKRYAGMVGIGQQAAALIQDSYWDYRLQHTSNFIVHMSLPFSLYSLSLSILTGGRTGQIGWILTCHTLPWFSSIFQFYFPLPCHNMLSFIAYHHRMT